MSDSNRPPRLANSTALMRARGRVAVVKGQDSSRFTDFYHGVLMVPWWLLFLELLAFFILVNSVFAVLYLLDVNSFRGTRAGAFWNTNMCWNSDVCPSERSGRSVFTRCSNGTSWWL